MSLLEYWRRVRWTFQLNLIVDFRMVLVKLAGHLGKYPVIVLSACSTEMLAEVFVLWKVIKWIPVAMNFSGKNISADMNVGRYEYLEVQHSGKSGAPWTCSACSLIVTEVGQLPADRRLRENCLLMSPFRRRNGMTSAFAWRLSAWPLSIQLSRAITRYR